MKDFIVQHPALFSLFFKPWFFISVAIGLLGTQYRDSVIRALLITLCISGWNSVLKDYFQIPLAAHVGSGWAFPSGHTHAHFMFWLWLAYEINRAPLWVITMTGSCMASCSIIMAGYHDPAEIIGAHGFAMIEFGLLQTWLYYYPQHRRATIFGSTLCALTAGIGLYASQRHPTLMAQTFSASTIITLGWIAYRYYWPMPIDYTNTTTPVDRLTA